MYSRTAMYARVSSEHQAKDGTIESQIAAIRAYIREHGWELEPGSEYIDNGISGRTLERPGMERLRDQIAAQQYQRVVVLGRDRLSRVFVHQEYLREEWKKKGCELVYVQESNAKTPDGLLAGQLQGLFAEYDRQALLDRTRRGQLHRAQQGEPYGRPPWGYRYMPSEGRIAACWKVETEAADWVHRVYVWVGQEHLAIREVARRLNDAGVQTQGGGAAWRESSVHRVLTNPAYRGETYYHRSIGKAGKQIAGPWKQLRPNEEWIAIPVPALVTENEWQMVQEELDRHRQTAQRHATPQRYLLQGLLKCGQCGRKLAGRNQSKHLYYACRKKKELLPSERCPSAWNRAESLEAQVWEAVVELIMSPEQVFASYQEQRQTWLAGESEQERQALAQESERLSKQWDRMVTAYRQETIGLEDLEQYRQRKQLAEQDLNNRKQIWEKRQKEVAGFAAALSQLEKYRSTIQSSVDSLTFEQKRELLTLLVEEVVVYEDKLVIRHILPGVGVIAFTSP